MPLTAADVAFTYNYIVKNQMANYTNSTLGIKSATALDPTTVRIVCASPRPTGYSRACRCRSSPSTSGSTSRRRRASTSYAVKLPLVGSGPFQTVAFVKGSYIEMVETRTTGAPSRPSTNLLRGLPERRHHGERSEQGLIDAAWGIPQAQFKALKSVQRIKAMAYTYYSWDYLEFNCYDKPSSMGNPVLRDWQFRNAMNYALNKQRLCQLAYAGYAQPATTIIPPGIWTNPDYHWQPPAEQALHLRSGQGQPAAHRGRLPAQERRAPQQAGQADHAAAAWPRPTTGGSRSRPR